MRVFIAGASGDRKEVARMLALLPDYRCTGYNWPSNPDYEIGPGTPRDPLATAQASEMELLASDALILFVTEKPSPGAVGEARGAHYLGIPIVVLIKVPGTIYGPDCWARTLRQTIPPENIWAHFLANQHPNAGTFEEAMQHLGCSSPFGGRPVTRHADGTPVQHEPAELALGANRVRRVHKVQR